MEIDEAIVIPRTAAGQLALHAKLAAHYTAGTGLEPAACEAVLAWALLVAAGADPVEAPDAMPTSVDVRDGVADLPAYRAAAAQAEQLATHFDCEELVELTRLYETALLVIEEEIERIDAWAAGQRVGQPAR